MSKCAITKEVMGVTCDFCDKEIDTEKEGYCNHDLKSVNVKAHKYGVTHFIFSWYRINANRQREEYVQYDFHADCFDKLMRKFLAEKGKS